jgi:hypothetical protein
VVVVVGRVDVDEVVVDEEVLLEVVVVSGRVVVVLVDDVVVVVDVVVVGELVVVNAESGTISKPALSMFQANMMHVPPPFSYIHNSSG